jgi:hypothetical protein
VLESWRRPICLSLGLFLSWSSLYLKNGCHTLLPVYAHASPSSVLTHTHFGQLRLIIIIPYISPLCIAWVDASTMSNCLICTGAKPDVFMKIIAGVCLCCNRSILLSSAFVLGLASVNFPVDVLFRTLVSTVAPSGGLLLWLACSLLHSLLVVHGVRVGWCYVRRMLFSPWLLLIPLSSVVTWHLCIS